MFTGVHVLSDRAFADLPDRFMTGSSIMPRASAAAFSPPSFAMEIADNGGTDVETVVFGKDGQAYPDTLVGTDSHTTMINGLGILGWGVGGIEAEAAMLGQAISMLIPQVVGFKFEGELPEGATALRADLTDQGAAWEAILDVDPDAVEQTAADALLVVFTLPWPVGDRFAHCLQHGCSNVLGHCQYPRVPHSE